MISSAVSKWRATVKPEYVISVDAVSCCYVTSVVTIHLFLFLLMFVKMNVLNSFVLQKIYIYIYIYKSIINGKSITKMNLSYRSNGYLFLIQSGYVDFLSACTLSFKLPGSEVCVSVFLAEMELNKH
jgi:hypothetical protein